MTPYQSSYLSVALASDTPAFSVFAVDSLGRGKLDGNPVLLSSSTSASSCALREENQTYYTESGQPLWCVAYQERSLVLTSFDVPAMESLPFRLVFDQRLNHATMLGRMAPGHQCMPTPCILHMPGMGSLRITSNNPAATVDYDALRGSSSPAFVSCSFPPASAACPQLEYRLEVVTIHPDLPGLSDNPRYDGVRRDWLSVFQINPRLQILANNSASDACAFTLFEYSEIALHTPPLADNLTCLDLIRMSLERYLSGHCAYGQVGHENWRTPWTSLDSLPSLLIAACNYVNGTGDWQWAHTRFDELAAWGRTIFAADKNGNGLIEYPASGNYGDRPTNTRRPANWWDTINFGHEDAFSNALAYRSAVLFAKLARQLGRDAEADLFADKAARLHAAYQTTFFNPETEVLAGWKSADGQLHDYWFTFVQGLAITVGLVDESMAHAIMDRILTKLERVGFHDFRLGLPGNLVPVRKGDYVNHEGTPEQYGIPQHEDGSDGFQFYENGGATACWAYYTIKALYLLGRVREARQIFHPLLAGFAADGFQGFDDSGRSRDWRDWDGHCHGYEGLLADNYLALLAVLDDVTAT